MNEFFEQFHVALIKSSLKSQVFRTQMHVLGKTDRPATVDGFLFRRNLCLLISNSTMSTEKQDFETDTHLEYPHE